MVQVNIKRLIDDVQCYQTIRELRWPDGMTCPSCQSTQVIKRGFDDTEPARQRYECHDCDTRFDDLTDTIFAGHHQPLKVWVLCLSFMGLHISNEPMAQELALNGREARSSADRGAPSTRTETLSPLVSTVPAATMAFWRRTTSRIWSTGMPSMASRPWLNSM